MRFDKKTEEIIAENTDDAIFKEMARLYLHSKTLSARGRTYADKAKELASYLHKKGVVKMDGVPVQICKPSEGKIKFDYVLFKDADGAVFAKLTTELLSLGIVDPDSYYSPSHVQKWLRMSGQNSHALDNYIIPGAPASGSFTVKEVSE